MLFIRKKYIDEIKKYLDNKNAIILVGARQVGKSSIIKSLIEQNIIEKEILLSGDDFILEDFSPKDFLDYLNFRFNLSEKKYLIIDEAQKIKNIGIIIKYLVDNNKEKNLGLKIIISGSGSLQIFKGITDSLIGRYNLIKVKPFSFKEFLEFNNFRVDDINFLNIPDLIYKEISKYADIYFKYGGYPEVVKAKTIEEKKNIFKGIYEDYLYKDIGFLLKEDENIYFIKFLKLFTSKIGSLIKAEQIISELGIKKKLYDKFKQILESSFLFDFVDPFTTNIGNEIKKSKKGYMLDIGFINYILGIEEQIGDFKGKIIENFIYTELCFLKKNFEEIKFWQNRNQTEVDFVLIDNFDKKIFPIEVKTGKKDIIPKSLLSFISKYSKSIEKALVTSSGVNKIRKEGKDIIFIDYKIFFSYFYRHNLNFGGES